MTNPEICGWQSVGVRAILEKDDLPISGRIYEAGSSTENIPGFFRWLSPFQGGE
jgi:hypothetical protein